LPARSKRPVGDVGVRLGGSEHHQGSAPALRFCRPPRWSAGVTSASAGEAFRPPRGSGGDFGRRTVWTISPTLSGGQANRVGNGFGLRRRTVHRAGLGQQRARAHVGFGQRGHRNPDSFGSTGCTQPRQLRLDRLHSRRQRLRPAAAHRYRSGGFGCRNGTALGSGRAGPGEESVQHRQEGNGRSDAVRLLMRGTLRRV